MPGCFRHRAGQARRTGAMVWPGYVIFTEPVTQQMLTGFNWNCSLSMCLIAVQLWKKSQPHPLQSKDERVCGGGGGTSAPLLNRLPIKKYSGWAGKVNTPAARKGSSKENGWRQ